MEWTPHEKLTHRTGVPVTMKFLRYGLSEHGLTTLEERRHQAAMVYKILNGKGDLSVSAWLNTATEAVLIIYI